MASLCELGGEAGPIVDHVVDADSAASVEGVCRALALFDAGASLATSVIPGGITNRLFRVRGPARSVLVRVYGGEGLIDRAVETATFAALCAHLGRPALLGRFANGRAEEFLDGHSTCDLAGMRTHAPKIAAALRRFHAFVVPAHLRPHHATCGLWSTLDDWRAKAFDGGRLDALKARDPGAAGVLAHHADVFDGARIAALIERLRKAAPPPTPDALVFAHNDLLSGNLMVDDASGEVRVIDLEYGGINYAAFDVANHLMEWAGGTGQPGQAAGVPDGARRDRVRRHFNVCLGRPSPGS
jgi:thiamine kinase-like enzyme